MVFLIPQKGKKLLSELPIMGLSYSIGRKETRVLICLKVLI